MRIKLLTSLVLASMALSTAGCNSLRGWMGGDKAPPDEFRVVTRAPLSLPPDYGLVAPQPGAPRPQETDARESARQIVVDRQGGAAAQRQQQQAAALQGRPPAEAALLKRAGVAEADPNIRATVNRESSKLAEADNTFVNKLMFWRGKEEPGVIVDADKEAKRIRENTALGRAPTTGETPTISRKGEGGGLFGSL